MGSLLTLFLVGAFSLKEKSPTLTVSSFFFSWQSHSEWSTFLTIFVHLSYLFIFHPSVCRKRWMSLNGLFLSFSALCDLKNTFFEKKIKIFFLKKNFFPNFSNSCSLNIFEPKIWRRLGTFPSCLFYRKFLSLPACIVLGTCKLINQTNLWFHYVRNTLTSAINKNPVFWNLTNWWTCPHRKINTPQYVL